MAVPKRKISSSRRGMRRGGQPSSKVGRVQYSADQTTGELRRSHHVSPDGYYNGRQVTEDKVNL